MHRFPTTLAAERNHFGIRSKHPSSVVGGVDLKSDRLGEIFESSTLDSFEPPVVSDPLVFDFAHRMTFFDPTQYVLPLFE